MKQNKIVVITGSIGSGKSTVTKILQENNFTVIDADEISRKIYLKGKKAYFEIIEKFGERILNSFGEIDRKKLGYIVFSNENKRKLLNKITHKYIFSDMKCQIDMLKNKEETLFLDIPIYFEVQDTLEYIGIVPDMVCLVYSPKNIQVERIQKRDGLSISEVENRLKSQLDNYEVLKKADYIIANDGTMSDLYIKVERFLNRLNI